ncbi:hypothetical protein [Hymenobacter glacialis]|uniref:Lipoprotein n=1 Tax=Hymenobacter glacialis TaxID=1908236 RepID=A0A1G1T6L1_9BACT|nr:hypothetical protein [Hymenobacter glacialis]OGX86515.1 hypothetical protein BEN48_12865 [Hymenobacter glacialis]
MKILLGLSLSLALLLTGSGCTEKTDATPTGQTCKNERVLEDYQNREAVVTLTQLDTYCLIVDTAAIARGSYRLEHYLVPAVRLPSQYQVEGLRVRLTGRKKSCYGLTTFPNLRNMFGYKLEVDNIQFKDR